MCKKGKDCCPEPKGQVPEWFMTYSDVITLLMTFFILLLTFASNEPEFFAQVQVVTFGGGGSTGVAGESDNLLDQDSVVLRERPNASRRSTRGSEMPPFETDPATESVAKGLKALENSDELADAERVQMQTPLSVLRSGDGKPTPLALQQLRMLALQMKNLPLAAEFRVSSQNDADFCLDYGLTMTDVFGITPGRISITVADASITPPGALQIVVSRTD